MRDTGGKLIAVWSPGLHGMGVSTVADAVGFAMQYLTNKRVLILNCCGCMSYLERFLEEDIRIKYTLDNLKIFNGNISIEHIYTYATPINDNLYMIYGSRFRRDITREDRNFLELLLLKCLEAFDIVIADIDTGVREESTTFLDKADSILAVATANEIMLDDLLDGSRPSAVKDYIYSEKTSIIFNKLFEGWAADKAIRHLSKKYSFSNSFGLNYDGEVFNACCRNRQFYSFMMEELRSSKAAFGTQVTELCDFLIEKLYIGRQAEVPYKRKAFLSFFTM